MFSLSIPPNSRLLCVYILISMEYLIIKDTVFILLSLPNSSNDCVYIHTVGGKGSHPAADVMVKNFSQGACPQPPLATPVLCTSA